MVFEGKVDLAFGLSIHSYYISKYGLLGVKPVFTLLERPSKVGMAVRTDWPELVSILNKTIIALQQDELPRIMKKWFVAWPEGLKAPSIYMTPEEKAWIETRPTIKVRLSKFPPYILSDQGKPAGFTVELLERIADLTGLDLKFIPGVSWPEGLEEIKRQDGKVDLIPNVMNTPERREYMLFSGSYIEHPYVIYTRRDNLTIRGIDDLNGKTVAIEERVALVKMLRRAYPDIRLMKIKGYAPKALRAVSSGDADAYIGIMPVTNYHIGKLGLIHLKSVATAPVPFNTLSMGVRKEWPELVSILNKGLDTITSMERLSMLRKWGGAPQRTGHRLLRSGTS